MEPVPTGQHHTILTVRVHQANAACTIVGFLLILSPFCKVNDHDGGAELGESLLLWVASHEDGVGGAYQRRARQCGHRQEFIKEHVFGNADPEQTQCLPCGSTPQQEEGEKQQQSLLVDG